MGKIKNYGKALKMTNEEQILTIIDGDYDKVLQSLIPLVVQELGKKYYYRNDYQDVLQVGLMACYNAITKFDAMDGRAQLGTYCIIAAHRAAEGYITRYSKTIRTPCYAITKKMDEEQKQKVVKAISTDDNKFIENNGPTQYDDINVYQLSIEDELKHLLSQLPIKNRAKQNIKLIIEYYLDNHGENKLEDLAQKYGITKQAVHQKIKYIFQKLDEAPKIKEKIYDLLTNNY
jgi:RNA polymerase sigma factor (sigma-70 family)